MAVDWSSLRVGDIMYMNMPSIVGHSTVSYFTLKNSTITTEYTMWNKPYGCSMVWMMVGGGGAGGGGGCGSTAGSARGGGGSGGGSGVTKALIAACMIPDILIIRVGRGGAGGAGSTGGGTGTSGSSGIKSYVMDGSISTTAGELNLILSSSSSSPTGGGGGSTASGGSAGAGGTASGSTSQRRHLGVHENIIGNAGVVGGAQTGENGTSKSYPTSGIFCFGGCGGAGAQSADFAGGSITPIADSIISECLPAAGAAGSVNGDIGNALRLAPFSFGSKYPFFNHCGYGGGSSNSTVGGNGGDGGGYGCGGSGGGAGVTTGGRGGDGASGIVVLIAW